MKRDKLLELWEGRDPEFESQYEDSVIRNLCDYGKGTSQYQDARGKVLGAGYEVFIMAFFIGLYIFCICQRKTRKPSFKWRQKILVFATLPFVGTSSE